MSLGCVRPRPVASVRARGRRRISLGIGKEGREGGEGAPLEGHKKRRYGATRATEGPSDSDCGRRRHPTDARDATAAKGWMLYLSPYRCAKPRYRRRAREGEGGLLILARSRIPPTAE